MGRRAAFLPALLALLALPAAGAGPGSAADPGPAGPAARPAGFMRGIALGLYHREADRKRYSFPGMLGEIRGAGADHVSLVVSWKQHDVRSEALAPDEWVTIPDDRLRGVIREARRRGLKVFLFPIVEIEVRRPLEWRGTIRPRDVDLWWRSYERFILHYARIAADEKVDLFSVGSELVSTETWRDRWYHLISAVERIYPGALLYSANWDHYREVSFWERLDYAGVTAYNELSKKRDASVEELTAAWSEVRARLAAFSRDVDRPIVITEVGYTSQDGAAVHPWDYTSRAALDLEEQRRCYAAFVAAWKDEPRLAGVFFWQWFGRGGPKDATYSPKGKPAEKVLRSFFSSVAR